MSKILTPKGRKIDATLRITSLNVTQILRDHRIRVNPNE